MNAWGDDACAKSEMTERLERDVLDGAPKQERKKEPSQWLPGEPSLGGAPAEALPLPAQSPLPLLLISALLASECG